MFVTIDVTTDARGVAVLSLERADKHNAMSAQMISELTQAAAQLASDQAVRVVVLRAAGKTFFAPVAIWHGCANRWRRTRKPGFARRASWRRCCKR